LGARDNLQARKLYTQVRVANRVLGVALAVVVLALVCMRFETFRQLGAGLLASAGVAGLVVGLAAQKTIAGALAGIQLALTQPIRLDDVVVVEGEWGRIEEITLTYVVVRVWDQRRLVLPVSRFLDASFQNWTRVSAEVWGTALLYVDLAAPRGRHPPGAGPLRGAAPQVGRQGQRPASDERHGAQPGAARPGHRRGFRGPVGPALRRAGAPGRLPGDHHPESLPRTRAEVAGRTPDLAQPRGEA
jgi:hypothetical protein